MGELEASTSDNNQRDINKIVDNMDLFDDDLMALVFKKKIYRQQSWYYVSFLEGK